MCKIFARPSCGWLFDQGADIVVDSVFSVFRRHYSIFSLAAVMQDGYCEYCHVKEELGIFGTGER